jgi:adenylate cyclase
MRGFLRNPTWRGIWLGLACAFTSWLLMQTALFVGLEDWMLDACYAWRGARPSEAQKHIVLIGIDEDTFDELKKPAAYISPQLAQVVAYAKEQRAAAIGVDLFVPASMSALPEIEKRDGAGGARSMGDIVDAAKNVVLPAWAGKDSVLLPLLQWQIKWRNPATSAPTDVAFVNLTTDGDQFVRSQTLVAGQSENLTPQFALALLAVARGEPWHDANGRPLAAGKPVPLEGDGKLRINFVGPPETFQPVSFRTVLEDAKSGRPRPEMRGSVVLIGVTAPSQQGVHPTPFANYYARWTAGGPVGLMSGVEIQANTLATLYDGAYVRTPWPLQPLPLLLLFGAGLGWAFARMNLRGGFLLALAHHFAWKGLALAAFVVFFWRIHVAAMLLLGALSYGATFALRWRKLRHMFGLVKSEEVALALESDPRRLDPGGEDREVTVLFADVRGFTDFSEKHTPREVVTLLNAYFAAIVPAIEAEGGTVASYMGDGIMVLFNAPGACPGHPLRAVRAAVEMVRRVHGGREEWAKLGSPDFRIGVGVHTGDLVVGAVGSPGRLDYTVIGDTVNTAARIESENKAAGTEILISAATYAALPERERARLGCAAPPREAHVKGKEHGVVLYPVLVP